MMDALRTANDIMEVAAGVDDIEDKTAFMLCIFAQAQAYAAIAQAEQLKRIADVLESVITPGTAAAIRVDDGKP